MICGQKHARIIGRCFISSVHKLTEQTWRITVRLTCLGVAIVCAARSGLVPIESTRCLSTPIQECLLAETSIKIEITDHQTGRATIVRAVFTASQKVARPVYWQHRKIVM